MLAGCGLDAAVSASGHPFSANDRYGGRKLPIGLEDVRAWERSLVRGEVFVSQALSFSESTGTNCHEPRNADR